MLLKPCVPWHRHCRTQPAGVSGSNGQVPHRLARIPAEDLTAHLLMDGDMAVELDGVSNIQALNLPGVAKVEPIVWLFVLEAIDDVLQAASIPLSSSSLFD